MGRGRYDAELAGAADHHLVTAYMGSGDAGDKGAGLNFPEAHGVRFGR